MKRTRLMLKPGQRGTKKLTELYGDQLICIRYRYDAENGRRYKTVELIVDEGPWIPRKCRIQPGAMVDLKIGFSELDLQKKISIAGGRWDSKRCVWVLRYDRALMLGLENRIQG
ncbi:MAG: hypothetical protein IPM66_14900 [Acidobacteriota bacterium]|nr:MAG: hypothetical protein IPM66_14900 [Acidobacteriota bacterium]